MSRKLPLATMRTVAFTTSALSFTLPAPLPDVASTDESVPPPDVVVARPSLGEVVLPHATNTLTNAADATYLFRRAFMEVPPRSRILLM